MIEIRTSPDLERFDGKQMRRVGGEVIATVEAETLVGADLSGLNLDWANLTERELRDANFSHSSLTGANLSQADLRGANFDHAVLAGTNLWGANMAGASLNETFLAGAHLEGADLRQAHLNTSKLKYARYDETTLWPDNFDPQAQGALLPSQVRR
jgi:uncharacterized protein YjbI with pentapeptide repeats